LDEGFALSDYTFHPAANEFPLLDDKRLAELAEDILQNSQRETIKLYDGAIVDGRNRYRACLLASIPPRVETLDASIDPWAYVWSLNGERRDLTADQRYLIWKSCHEKSEAWDAERRRIASEANRKRAAATREQPRAEDGTMQRKPVDPQVVGQPARRDHTAKHASSSTAAKAEASKTNRGAVERMDALSAKRPDLAEKVKTGEIKSAEAIREMKREEIVAKLEDVKTKEVKAASGVYDVIVIDPPWPMQKIERDERPNQSEFDYPTMSEEDLAALKIPAADDCHMWQWTTHKFLPMALRLLDAWGFKYVCCFVWHKPGGFQPIGLPQYNCEFAIYARKGSPKFIDTRAFNTCFDAPRGGHSEKPEAFYDVVHRVTAGRRLDMFNRRAIDGFDVWGNEAADDEAAA
jgi:N6-adenosine-specific RNA methylase IME4